MTEKNGITTLFFFYQRCFNEHISLVSYCGLLIIVLKKGMHSMYQDKENRCKFVTIVVPKKKKKTP